MSQWNEIYSNGTIHSTPSKELTLIVETLQEKNVIHTLDAGCGTGRHAKYLAQQGFISHGIDISSTAIEEAKETAQDLNVNYKVGELIKLPYQDNSMDFIIANQSLQYASDEDVKKSITELDRVLKPNKPVLIRVSSDKHVFNGATPNEIYGFSHIGFSIKEGLPVHFFSESELREYFKSYNIERLEHITHTIDHDKISVPLSEWVLLADKK